MLHIVTALHCEAKPLIEFYQLKSVKALPFPRYQNGNIVLVISGVGKVNAAAATASLYSQKNQRWLNIGIGGHRHLEVGTAVVAHKIQGNFYPFLPKKNALLTAEFLTVDKPNTQYDSEVVYEMESAGFYTIASRFSTVERIHSLKIISDNHKSSTDHLNKQRVEELIRSQLDKIDHFIQQIPQGESQDLDICRFTQKWHFTETQSHTLKQLLKRWEACSVEELFDSELDSLKKTQDVLKWIHQKIESVPLCFNPSTSKKRSKIIPQ